jgi:small-conductance mechanosensitive channel
VDFSTLLPVLKEFGFPVALCAALLWAIRQQNMQLVKAYTDRISVLERMVKSLTEKVDDLERDRIQRADDYGQVLRSVIGSGNATARETNEVTRGSLAVLRKLCDALNARPCLDVPAQPRTPRPPSADEVPPDPAKAITDRFHNGG